VETCPNLTHLQLSEIGKLDDASLGQLHPLVHLVHLDVSSAGNITDDGVVPLIKAVGAKLEVLILDKNENLTDRVLVEGVKTSCTRLSELSLGFLPKLQSAGVEDLFTKWVNRPLTRLNLHRCIEIEDNALRLIVDHSGASLQFLDLNSDDELREDQLKYMAERCVQMRELDVSFVRE
jgi:DNA repair protein RAD7